tara:strand:+ start:489 stop:668 length:180 start_codon:yes stop_codon:yes gene_type:complete
MVDSTVQDRRDKSSAEQWQRFGLSRSSLQCCLHLIAAPTVAVGLAAWLDAAPVGHIMPV